MSDPLPGPLELEDELEDLTAVLDAAGSERAALFAYTTSGPMATLYSIVHPERVGALVLYATMVVAVADEEVDWTLTAEERQANADELLSRWGEGSNIEVIAPSAAGDEHLRAWFARLERLAASPGQMRGIFARAAQWDVRRRLGEVRVPTLVLHRTDDKFIDVRHSRYLAERIPGARLVELPGDDSLPSLGDSDALIAEIQEFLTGGRSRAAPDRVLLTVLFTDIVGGTARAAELGDRRWRDLLAAHDATVRKELRRHGGREVKTIGDGFLAVFDGAPSHAVHAACSIVAAAEAIGLDVRAGLHTGECELIGDDVGGMAVHIAARVAALAGPREVFASGTTFGTVVGSGLRFEFLGERELRGVEHPWPIFRWTSSG
jgi:class 3 adenylate cyclase